MKKIKQKKKFDSIENQSKSNLNKNVSTSILAKMKRFPILYVFNWTEKQLSIDIYGKRDRERELQRNRENR